MKQQTERKRQSRRNAVAGVVLLGAAFAMLGAAYAAVPLYRIFCQVTGYGGTTQRAEVNSNKVLKRTITVRFDANVSRDMPWTFRPVVRKMVVHIGENKLAFFRATNNSDEVVTGSAAYNIAPDSAGAFFDKIQCFCFTEQTLQPHQTVDMPVTFFVDPDIVKDPDAGVLSEITLSYKFYPSKKQPPHAAAKKTQVGAVKKPATVVAPGSKG